MRFKEGQWSPYDQRSSFIVEPLVNEILPITITRQTIPSPLLLKQASDKFDELYTDQVSRKALFMHM